MRIKAIFLGVILLAFVVTVAAAQGGYQAVTQTPQLASEEVDVAYLTNQYRAQSDLPPLKMNWQLTQASRWFAQDKDSVSHSQDCIGSIDHLDSLGNYPEARAAAFGYPGNAGTENVWCTYLDPQSAMEGWMSSAGHEANILNTYSREFGVGYSQSNEGWLAEDFGNDPDYAPAVINDEALQTTSPDVNLYVYDTQTWNNIQSLRPAVQVQVSEDECSTDAAWQDYSPDLTYTLSNGDGWKTVYVRSRDAYGHTSTVSDGIYLGDSPNLDEIGEAQMSTVRPSVTLHQLAGNGRNYVQFSPGWLGDAFEDRTNSLLEQSNDSAAWNGKTTVLSTENGQDFAWVWSTSFLENTPLVAYVRLKVSDKQQSGSLASITVTAGTNSYGPIDLTGSDFPASDQYTEVAVPFTYAPDTSNPFLEFVVQRSGSADVSVDAVTVFTAPQPLTGSTMTWTLPNDHYRGEGIWVRYSNPDGSNFTPFSEGLTAQPSLAATPTSFSFLADLQSGDPQPTGTVNVQTSCGSEFTWTASSEDGWLQASTQGSQVHLSVDPSGVTPGEYDTRLVLQANGSSVPTVYIPVHLVVAVDLNLTYLPVVEH